MLSYAVPVDLSRGTPDIKRRHFVLTFDDGLQDFYDNALPELSARNVPCVLFAVSGALGKVARWGESYYGELLPIMSDETLRRITEFITVGSHTVNHVKLTETNVEHARQEITHSRKQLQQLLGTEIQYFSFPEGEYNQTLLNLCREVGYRHVFTTSPTLAFTSGDDFLVGRVATDADDWLIETLLKILGAYRWLPVAFRLSSAIRKRIVRK
jgi:peptidoglycan/xylan/chitin deacetylase (PgdA/CDA1 family)